MEALDGTTLLLLSGGMDSAAIAYWKRPRYALTINYGQRAATAEARAAKKVCASLGITHHKLSIDCSAIGVGDMAGRPSPAAAPTPEWWPFRNQMLATFAAVYAIRLDVSRVMIGTLKTDHIHADGTAEFIATMDNLLHRQEGSLRFVAPAIGLTAAGLIRRSAIPSKILRWSHSCHVANHACGACRGCTKRQATWIELAENRRKREARLRP